MGSRPAMPCQEPNRLHHPQRQSPDLVRDFVFIMFMERLRTGACLCIPCQRLSECAHDD
jgi:hypothetical protein